MSDLREKIVIAVDDVYRDRISADDATDRIIALVHEALLSDEAVEAAGDGWLEKSMEYWSRTRFDTPPSAAIQATAAFRNAIEAALATAGLGGQGDEC